jgi:hypothetical protein
VHEWPDGAAGDVQHFDFKRGRSLARLLRIGDAGRADERTQAMETMTRYHILQDKAQNRVMIFDALSGAVQYPACWQDIAAYYHYLLGRNRLAEAQTLLAEAMSGAKPMTRMVQSARCTPPAEQGWYAVPSVYS